MPRKLVWTEGLFLTQHHFQQLDRYHEALLRDRLRAVLSYDWGVTELGIDERALATGQLRVERFSAVFPSGAFVSGGDGHGDAIAARPFDALFAPTMMTLDVHVALAQDAEAGPIVGLDAATAATARYSRAQDTVQDANSGGVEHAVDVARPNLRVLFGDERRDAYESIRVAQLERAASGAIVLREAGVPPVLRVGASPFLVRGLRAVLASMTARQRAFAASRRQRTSGAVELDAADAVRFWGLSTLNGAIPLFMHLTDTLDAPPERAYLALAQLVGQLCSFVPDGDPTAIPKFNYLDLGATFGPLFARALELISTTLQERCVELPLTRRADGVHVGEIAGGEIARSDFFLSVSGTLPEAQVRERLPRLVKVASANQIGAILHSAVGGAPVELEYRPPSALPMRPGLTWFRLTPASEFWADIATSGTFAIYHPFDPQSLVLGLFAVEKQDRK